MRSTVVLLREVFQAHHGREVDAEGDAYFIGFEGASHAVAAAVAVQRALLATGEVRVRIGLHTTEPHLHAEGYIGVGVSRAARICGAAHGGQIVVSQATAGIVEDGELLDVRLRDLGEHHLKDVPRPQRLFQIDADGLPSKFPPLGAKAVAGTIATLLAIDVTGAVEYADRWPQWGSRTIATLMRIDGHDAPDSTTYRALKRAGRVLEVT